MQKHILLSVVVPIKNIENWESNIFNNIDICNNSLENAFEIIFVSSKEPDESIQKLKSKLETNLNTIFVEDNSTGIYSAMNKGIITAQGKYIIFLGADDTLIEDSLKGLINDFRKDNNCSLILTEAMLSTDSHKMKKKGNKLACGLAGRVHWLLASPRIHQAIIYKKDIITRFNLKYSTDLDVTSDYIFTSEILAMRPKIKNINKCLVVYNTTGFSSNYTPAQNYIEHIKGYTNSKILRKYLPLVITARLIMISCKVLISYYRKLKSLINNLFA